MPVLSTVDTRGTALVTQVCKRAPEAQERQDNGTANCKADEVSKLMQWCYSTLCLISELHDPVDSQHQLECISPPVGRLKSTGIWESEKHLKSCDLSS